jgi:hypothetical protein
LRVRVFERVDIARLHGHVGPLVQRQMMIMSFIPILFL